LTKAIVITKRTEGHEERVLETNVLPANS